MVTIKDMDTKKIEDTKNGFLPKINKGLKTAMFYGVGMAIVLYDVYKRKEKEKDLFEQTMDYLII